MMTAIPIEMKCFFFMFENSSRDNLAIGIGSKSFYTIK